MALSSLSLSREPSLGLSERSVIKSTSRAEGIPIFILHLLTIP